MKQSKDRDPNKPFIGLMSGTSMDGIDCALVDVDTHQLIDGLIYPYPAKIKPMLDMVVQDQHVDLAQLAALNRFIGDAFADAALEIMSKNKLQTLDVAAIGSHGQTVFHAPDLAVPFTCQLGCPHTIAENTGVLVVADFRTRDLVLGGEGAPFAPLYHKILFSHLNLPLIVVNIGGIANVSVLPDTQSVFGFDVGPGNCLMDAWCARHLGQPYDVDGAWACQGTIIERLLTDLLSDPFIQREEPKSIGKEYFSLQWLEAYLMPTDKPEDVQATLLEFTAQSIARTICNIIPLPNRVLGCGGGVHNRILMKRLDELASSFSSIEVSSTQTLGINPDFIEAQLFAWLAAKALNKEPVDLRCITGARHPAVLGAIYPARAQYF